jgi:SecD/SecF fusion protein
MTAIILGAFGAPEFILIAVVVLIMFIFGGPAIKGFLFALLVGVVIGTYSSLCVATPILIDFSKRLKA